MKCCGPKGRWKSNLIGKCLRDGKSYDDDASVRSTAFVSRPANVTALGLPFDAGAL